MDFLFSVIALEGLRARAPDNARPIVVADPDPPARWRRHAHDYLEAHARTPVSLSEIAAAVGCDPVRLSRGFRHAFGHTIGHHQRKLRVAAAAEFVTRGRMPIAEIALACGFHDRSHHTRIFKAEIGCTPATFRRSA